MGVHEVVYLRRDGCPYCRAFDRVWARVVRDARAAPLRTSVRTVRGPLPRGVATVPTLQLVLSDGNVVFWGDSRVSADDVFRQIETFRPVAARAPPLGCCAVS